MKIMELFIFIGLRAVFITILPKVGFNFMVKKAFGTMEELTECVCFLLSLALLPRVRAPRGPLRAPAEAPPDRRRSVRVPVAAASSTASAASGSAASGVGVSAVSGGGASGVSNRSAMEHKAILNFKNRVAIGPVTACGMESWSTHLHRLTISIAGYWKG